MRTSTDTPYKVITSSMKNKKMKWKFIILLLLIFSLIQVNYAGNPHVLWGYCKDGHDGTSSSGAEVFIYIYGKDNETLTTTVGSNHVYASDASEFTEWDIGDVVVIKIEKDSCYADKTIILSSAGAQRIPDLALTCPEPNDLYPSSPEDMPFENKSVYLESYKNETLTGAKINESEINTSVDEPKEDNKEIKEGAEKETFPHIPENESPVQKEYQKEGKELSDYFPVLGLLAAAVIVILFFVLIRKNRHEANKTGKVIKPREIPKLTDDEIKVLKLLVSQSASEEELSQKIGPTVSYTLEKLKNYNIIYPAGSGKMHIHDWAKPKFIYEYILDSEQKNIVMLLKKESTLTQTRISRKTNISQSTLARRLEKLEAMKIIERTADGSRKNVKLAGGFKDNI